jgi:hypothetical protein
MRHNVADFGPPLVRTMTTRILTGHPRNNIAARDNCRSLFVTGGIGDLIALTCFLDVPPDTRTIYYATRKRDDVESYLSTLCPTTTNHVSVWQNWSARWGWYSLREFNQQQPRHVDAVDWSIATQFPRLSTFKGFPWEPGHPLSSIHKLNLPPRYAVFVPFSSDKRDPNRDFTAKEFDAALAAADLAGLPLVLLNRDDARDPEFRDGVIDLQNQTNVFGSIDVTIGASLFIGVDSAMSVVASKILPAERLLVKCVNAHCRRWQSIYFAPHTSFDFLTADPIPRLGRLKWIA